MRSIDLARTFRTISLVEGQPYILLQRKGWPQPRWEAIPQLPDSPLISPFHLAKAYVQLTAPCAVDGGPLLLSAGPPLLGPHGELHRAHYQALAKPLPHTPRGVNGTLHAGPGGKHVQRTGPRLGDSLRAREMGQRIGLLRTLFTTRSTYGGTPGVP